MFWPLFKKLQAAKPESQLFLSLWRGQEAIFPDAVPDEPEKYDATFFIRWSMENIVDGPDSKAEISCRDQLGIEPTKERAKFGQFRSPLVGVCFPRGGPAAPQVNIKSELAAQIWGEIEQAGFIPISLDTRKFACPGAPEPHPCETRHIRGLPLAASDLVGLIQRCYCFIGGDVGQYLLALSILPLNRILWIKSKFPAEGHVPCTILDPKLYEAGDVRKWLEKLA